MEAELPDWELAAFFGKINQYYFTGTMQDGVLLVPRDAEAVLCVRRSFERACAESLFPAIQPMKSFRDALPFVPAGARQAVHLETELVPLALVQRFRKHFVCREVASLDAQAAWLRAVKSPFELALMERCGELHRRVLEEGVPLLLREGMTEAELACELYSLLVREGHQGTVRFGKFNIDIAVGQLGFGVNSLYPTSFDGPGGGVGICPAAPVLGSRERKLRPGDLVFVDAGCAVDGYHTDKTMTYMFGRALPDEAMAITNVASRSNVRSLRNSGPARYPPRFTRGSWPASTPRFSGTSWASETGGRTSLATAWGCKLTNPRCWRKASISRSSQA